MGNGKVVAKLNRKLAYLRELEASQMESVLEYRENGNDYALKLTEGKLEQTKTDIRNAERLLSLERGGW